MYAYEEIIKKENEAKQILERQKQRWFFIKLIFICFFLFGNVVTKSKSFNFLISCPPPQGRAPSPLPLEGRKGRFWEPKGRVPIWEELLSKEGPKGRKNLGQNALSWGTLFTVVEGYKLLSSLF